MVLQIIARAVALMSKPMKRRSAGVLRIIAANSIAFTSGVESQSLMR
jgi:hypothetical protein